MYLGGIYERGIVLIYQNNDCLFQMHDHVVALAINFIDEIMFMYK